MSPESSPESSPFINIHETMGIKYFKGGPNISKNFGPGTQISRGPNIPLQVAGRLSIEDYKRPLPGNIRWLSVPFARDGYCLACQTISSQCAYRLEIITPAPVRLRETT